MKLKIDFAVTKLGNYRIISTVDIEVRIIITKVKIKLMNLNTAMFFNNSNDI